MSRSGRNALVLPAAILLLQCAVQADDTLSSIPVPPPEVTPAVEVETEDLRSPVVILDAIIQAYPGRVESLALRDGDWSVQIEDEYFYWAGGRLLPAAELENIDNYSPYSFRPNPVVLPELRVLDDEEKERLKSRIEQREIGKDARNPGFLTALWGMEDFSTAEDTVIHVEFFGRRLRVHPEIRDVLIAVETSILQAAQTDKTVETWISALGETGAYVWRDIAGSANRSLHSYGIAVDLVPEDYMGKQAYWRWAGDYYDEWWAIPYEDRYPIPDIVVEIFENNGFIWGGKWFLFDQIHFEYRPELILLGKIASGQK